MSSATVSRIFCIKETLERTLKGELKDQPIIDSQDKIVDYFRVAIGQSRTESLRVLYLDSNYRLVHEYIKDSINVDKITFSIKEIIEIGLAFCARFIIVAHNHPSGSLKPTDKDKESAIKLLSTCENMEMELLDNMIITSKGYCSFREKNLL